MAEVRQAIGQIESLPEAHRPRELTRLLADVREKLNDPGKVAAAKLKITLPIIPMLVSYEMQLDTEAVLVRSWRRIRKLFGSRI